MTTDTTEKGLEDLIVAGMTGPVPERTGRIADSEAEMVAESED